jgi:SAM-dependent methyltransferase
MVTGLDEYATLDPLKTRIAIHRQYSEHEDDIVATVLSALSPHTDAIMLDIGAGTGNFFGRLRSSGHQGRLVALDSSPAAVAEIGRSGWSEVFLGDAASLPFQNGVFDITTARHMLYHVPDVDRAVSEAARVTRLRGTVLASVNHREVLPRANEFVLAALGEVGFPAQSTAVGTDTDDLPPRFERLIGPVTVSRFDNALVFHEPEPAIKLTVAILGIYGFTQSDERFANVVSLLTQYVTGWFDSHRPPWRDAKGYSIVTAMVPA